MFARKFIAALMNVHYPILTVYPLIVLSACVSADLNTPIDAQSEKPADSCKPHANFTWNKIKPPKLIFLSIDSLNSKVLAEFLPLLRTPHPFGLKKILTHPNRNAELLIHDPTITASSHSSTITCSRAGIHGIFANSQWGGTKIVSGFSEPNRTETFATTLTNAGLTTVTAGYPILDNSEPGRKVSEGFSYGETIGQSALLENFKDGSREHVWKNRQDKIVGSITMRRNSEGKLSAECINQTCRIIPSSDGRLFNIEIALDNEKASGYLLQFDSPSSFVYVSQLAVNKAFPKRNAQHLAQCGIVFSPGKDISLSRFGADAVTLGLKHRFNFFKKAWTNYLPNTNGDALFLYLEDLDALRHQFSGDRDAQSAVITHLQDVDQLLGVFLQSLPAETNVVVMGDHGMSTVRKELNIRKILPKQVLNESIIFTSGGTLLIYGKNSQSGGNVQNVPSKADQKWLESGKDSLINFRLPHESRPIFEKVFIKNTQQMHQAELAHPNAPFLIAFANDSFALQDSVKDSLILADLDNPNLAAPSPRGQHGHNNLNPAMKSFLAIWGPELDLLDAKRITSNTDVVPAVAHALHWPFPKQCKSQDL